ncbi:MAG: glycosyltransferase family 9 protein, partial [Methanobacteriaceae archaeon]|nr:glycosyltransferase family 9 protein [Methanobacteriaceae archaeon]
WDIPKFFILYLVKLLRFNRKAKLQNVLNKETVKVFIVAFVGVGDFFLMTPMLKHIRDKIRNSHITLLTDNETIAEYLTGQSTIVDEPLVLKINEYSLSQFLRYCFSLRRQNIDILIIPYINLNQNTLLLGLLSRARLLIGHGSGGTYKNIWSRILDVSIPLKEKNYEPRQYLPIAEYITQSSIEDIRLIVEIPEHAENSIYSRLYSLGIDLSNSLLVQFSASDGKVIWKNWPPSHFAKLLDIVVEKYKMNVVAIGGLEEVEIADEVKRQMKHTFINLVGETTLIELIACVKIAKMVLCLDSSVLHITSAFKKPCIALFGPTDMWAYSGNSYAITNPVECQPCVSFINRSPLAGNVNYCSRRRCLNGIDVERVFFEFQQICEQL